MLLCDAFSQVNIFLLSDHLNIRITYSHIYILYNEPFSKYSLPPFRKLASRKLVLGGVRNPFIQVSGKFLIVLSGI